MKNVKSINPVLFCGFIFCILNFTLFTSCKVEYKFQDITIPDSIRTVKINFIENHGQYINPQFSPQLTDRLKQKIVNQTRLNQTNLDEKADWIIDGEVTEYYQSTSGITSSNGKSQTSINRLNVTVKITKREPNKDPKDYIVTRQYDFGANQSLQTAEARLMDEMVRNLVDEIFNSLFSGWSE
ncbi:MAG: LptE family protein [Flavisolibacter sp.]